MEKETKPENESSEVEPVGSPLDATSGMYFDEETCQEEIAAWGHPFGQDFSKDRKYRPRSQYGARRR